MQNRSDANPLDAKLPTQTKARALTAQHQRLLGFALFLVFLLLYLPLFKNAIIDDTYITLSYARTLAHSGTWGMYPGHPANTATSPLNVLLLAASGRLLGFTPELVLWLAAACFAAIAGALDHLSRTMFQTPAFGWIATLALLFNPLLISTLGLESILFATLLVLAIDCYVTEHWRWLGLIIGMLTITRPEGLLVALMFFLFLPRSRARLPFLAVFVLSSAPWYLFSWIALGSLIPDTLFIKSSMASYASVNYFNGLAMYLLQYPLETVLSLLFVPLLGTILIRPVRRKPVLWLLFVLVLAHFLGYSALHVPPFHWYYAPDITIAILFGTLSLGAIYQSTPGQKAVHVVCIAVAGECALVTALGMGWLLARQGFRADQMPIMTNWGTAAQYEQVGTWLEGHLAGKSLKLFGEIGTMSYYAPDCYLLNEFSDRRWLLDQVKEGTSQPGLEGLVYRVNFLFLRPGPAFPSADYYLNGYAPWDSQDTPHIMEWQTSTKWKPKGLVMLADQ